MTITFLVAIWGAAVSTILGVVKLSEMYRDRFRVTVSYSFSSAPDGSKKVIVSNLGSRPFILCYWKLLWLPHRWARERDVRAMSPDEDTTNSRLEPGASHTLTFSGLDHFEWDSNTLCGHTIYVRLYILGRRSRLRKVYG